MSKLSKVLVILCIVFCCFYSSCYGVDLNLTDANSSNSATTTSNTNNLPETNNSSNLANTQINNNSISNSNNNENISTTVSGVNSVSNSNSSIVSNILNIALIVVGVLLIFLAIAILIRLKKQD